MASRVGESALSPFKGLLGSVPDQKIADDAGVSRTLVVNYRKQLGIPAYDGHKHPPAGSARVTPAAPRAFRGRRSALDPFLSVLGKVPDAEVAKKAGVTAENVRTYRQRRDIPAVWPGAPTGAPVAPREAAPTPPAQAASSSPRLFPRTMTGGAAPARPPADPMATPSASAAPSQAAASPLAPAGTAFLVTVDTEQGPRSYAVVANDIASAAAVAAGRVSSRHTDGVIRLIQRIAELLP